MRHPIFQTSMFLAVLAFSACGDRATSDDDTVVITTDMGTDQSTPGDDADEGVDPCGNGVLDPGEACDPALGVDADGACPTECDDGLACTDDRLEGAGTCDARCVFDELAAGPADQCCPSGATPENDPDCSALCGNGQIDTGESCDTAIASGDDACPTTCDDPDPCVTGTLISAGTCDATCRTDTTTMARDGDACCPGGANQTTDADCAPVCGNGVVEEGEECDDDNGLGGDECSADCTVVCGNGTVETFETCDVAIPDGEPGACPTACDDGDPCTDDALDGTRCQTTCVATQKTDAVDGDGCCLDGTNPDDDSDCPDTCGNGMVEAWETCDLAIGSGMGSCPVDADCDDAEACTTDRVADAGTCDAACTNDPITMASDGDGCCPGGEDSRTDDDCDPVFQCERSETRLDRGSDGRHDLQVAELPGGDVVAIWIEDGSIGDEVSSAFFDATSLTWTTDVRVETALEDLHDLQLVVHPGGEVTAVWVEDGSIGDDVQASRWDGSSWSPEVLVESALDDLHDLQLALHGDDDVTAVWIEDGSIGDDVRFSRWDAATADWSTAVDVETAVEDLHDLQLVVDAADNLVAVWIEDGSIGDDVQSSRYDDTTGNWQSEVLVESSTQDLFDLQVVRNDSDAITAVWLEGGSIGDDVQASDYDGGNDLWSAEVLVESSVESLHDLRVEPVGDDIVAVWLEDGSIGDDVQSSRRDASTGMWSPEVLVESGLDDLHHLDVAVDPAGDVIAAWLEDGSIGDDVHASRHDDAAGAWSTEALVQSSLDDAWEVDVVATASGTTGAWIEGASADDVESTQCGYW